MKLIQQTRPRKQRFTKGKCEATYAAGFVLVFLKIKELSLVCIVKTFR